MRKTMRILFSSMAMALLLLAGVSPSAAQPLGTFRWQLAPFDEVVTLTVVVQGGGVVVLSGFSDRPGGERSAVYGTAFLRPDGVMAGMGFTTVFQGIAAQTDVVLSPATLSGTWRDDGGNSGTFVPVP